MSPVTGLGGLSILVGVCMLVGFATSLRNRAYLGLFGAGCALFGGGLLWRGVGGAALLWLSGGFVLASVISAVRETASRLRAIQEEHAARAAMLLEIIEQERQRQVDSK